MEPQTPITEVAPIPAPSRIYPSNTRRFVILSIILIVLVALFALVFVVYNNQNAQNTNNVNQVDNEDDEDLEDMNNEENQNDEDADTAQLSEFDSENYEVQFKYPLELGTASAALNTEYFNNEEVRFSGEERLSVSYWRFEGGFGPVLSTEQVESAEGHTFTINTYENSGSYSIFASGSQGNPDGTSVIVTFGALSQPELGEAVSLVKVIISNLVFDLSSVNRTEFTSEHFNFNFIAPTNGGTVSTDFNNGSSNPRCVFETITLSVTPAPSIKIYEDKELGAQSCLPATGGTAVNEYSRVSKNGVEFDVRITNTGMNQYFGYAIATIEQGETIYAATFEYTTIFPEIIEAAFNEMIDSASFAAGLK